MRWLVACVVMSALVGSTVLAAPIMPAGVLDTTTKGDWVGVYGADGYILSAFNGPAVGMNGADNASLPSYISSYNIGGLGRYTWKMNSTDPYDLQSPDGTKRNIGAWYTMNTSINTITLVPSQSQTFNLSLYLRDYQQGTTKRKANFSFAGAGLTGMDTIEYTELGQWITYTVTATAGTNITLSLQKVAGANATISALMFSPVPEPATLAMLLLGGLPMVLRRRRA